ncbi:MAG: hypothetical protein Ct9H300mP18_11100 [Candidatus Neomarinimicrobiota bacterium]|nr:MAG: hypothetical protein Ct9H300mP18_11100 [Candidatus Neomarinimicrobiota bacterium]
MLVDIIMPKDGRIYYRGDNNRMAQKNWVIQ